MLRRRHFVLTFATVFGLGLLGTVAFALPGPWSQLGQVYRPTGTDGEVVARVDGRSISRGELRIEVAILTLSNSVGPQKVSVDPKTALMRIAEVRSLSAEAARRGLTPSDTEVDAFITQVRQGFAGATTARQHLDEFLAGIGQTESEFFTSSFARSHYAEAAAIGRLRASIVTGLTPNAANGAWDAFAANTRQAAKVEILDPALR
jgi:hypothetical protein